MEAPNHIRCEWLYFTFSSDIENQELISNSISFFCYGVCQLEVSQMKVCLKIWSGLIYMDYDTYGNNQILVARC